MGGSRTVEMDRSKPFVRDVVLAAVGSCFDELKQEMLAEKAR